MHKYEMGKDDFVGYGKIWQPYREEVEERFPLCMERLEKIETEETVQEPYRDYFRQAAAFLREIGRLEEEIACGAWEQKSPEEKSEENMRLYQEVLPEHYGNSYASPAFAADRLGEGFGKLLSALYADFRSLIPYAFESRIYDITIFSELLVEIYNAFEGGELPKEREIQQMIYWFFHDYGEVFTEISVLAQASPELDFYTRIIMDSNLEDLQYLYRYGAYITENERKTAEFLNSLPQEQIQAMADTYTEGYRIGFEVTGKDLSKKKFVDLRYPIGFERMMRAAVQNFAKMGLEPVMMRSAELSFSGRGTGSRSVESTSPNRQYEFDHKADRALYLDKSLVERRLEVLKTAYEARKKEAAWYAGPAVVETFGQAGFEPKSSPCAWQYTEKQQKLNVYYSNMAAQITNTYIRGEERSFTIIAYPIPEIGPDYQEIFAKTVEVNTLDYKLYQEMQQKIIDVLDEGESVRITGKGKNTTDLTVALYPLKDRNRETAFENCVADVNIPVGEVFTSPVLKGTSGVLHVTGVYLNELYYKDLELTFTDGMVTGYTCANFTDPEENKRYVHENVMMQHETLPMGEFAIGTNTTAYRMARDFQIADNLPILIAEKTGPHFAVGDTCYSHAEDTKVYNPDGKEIMAKDNERTQIRKEDASKAYFNCHTDITIPYDELDAITAILPDGSTIDVIRDGRFVVPGTEQLNIPLEQ